MKKRTAYFFSLLSITILLSLFNCKGKQGDPGPAGAKGDTGTTGATGATGPALSGTISGVLTLTTSNGTPPANMSGVIVTNNKGASDTTNNNGEWSLPETTGVYTLIFTMAGYGTTTVYGSGFSGGGNSYLNTVALSQKPTFTVTSLVLSTASGTTSDTSTLTKDSHINAAITLGGTIPDQDLEVFVYYSTYSGVDTGNYMGMTVVTIPAWAGQKTSTSAYSASITGADLLAAQIVTGQTVYMVAYPSSAPTALSSKYVNESTGKTVYTSLGAASTVENIVVPD